MWRYKAGFSLIELMIAITLGLVLMGGVIQMFLGSKAAFSSQQATSQIQESGRLALEFLARDIRMAGYIGCSNRALSNFDSTLKNADTFPYFMLEETATSGVMGVTAVRGYSAEPAGANLTPDPLPDTDLIVITRAGGNDVTVSKNNDSATLFATLNQTEVGACTGNNNRLNGICPNDILIVTDCQKARIFHATNVNNSAGEIHITHAASGTPGNAPSAWGPGAAADPANTYGDGAQILKMERLVYYIAEGRSGLPSLWQNVNGVALEILEGVEDMHLTYGVDTNSDKVPDNYRSAAQIDASGVKNWFNVSSVRIQLLVQSMEDGVLPEKQVYSFGDDVDKQASDRRLRHVFVNTIGIRSRLD